LPNIKANPADTVAEIVYTGPLPSVEGAGFLFVRGEPVFVPAELAYSLIQGDFEYALKKEGK
jgi:hypothetical protein